MPIFSRKIRRHIARALIGLLACTWLTAAASPCFMDRSVHEQSMANMNCDKAADRVGCPAMSWHGCAAMTLDYRLSAQAVSVDTPATGALLAPPLFMVSLPQASIRPLPVSVRYHHLAVRPPQRLLHLQLVRLLT